MLAARKRRPSGGQSRKRALRSGGRVHPQEVREDAGPGERPAQRCSHVRSLGLKFVLLQSSLGTSHFSRSRAHRKRTQPRGPRPPVSTPAQNALQVRFRLLGWVLTALSNSSGSPHPRGSPSQKLGLQIPSTVCAVTGKQRLLGRAGAGVMSRLRAWIPPVSSHLFSVIRAAPAALPGFSYYSVSALELPRAGYLGL